MKQPTIALILLSSALSIFGLSPSLQAAPGLLIEAESFTTYGGWKIDTQFIETMGSPYLLAHGLGQAVDDAVTEVTIPKAGTWQVWVRTKDWVAPWKAEGAPGKFQVHLNGKALETTFGTTGAEWHWQPGGSIELPAGKTELRLHDLTGFNGRCDAIVLSMGNAAPPPGNEILPAWRRKALGLAAQPIDAGSFDVVFVGGGYAGMCGAVSAARMGLKVALIQNRDVLGGNGSSEVRVWAMGNTPAGLYPVGDIIQQFTDRAKASPGTKEEFGDDKKEKLTRAEKNLSLFLGHHAFDVEMAGNKIAAVQALEVRTGKVRNFRAPYFCDATGHGSIGVKAGAEYAAIPKGRMGMSNMWRWKNTAETKAFPKTTWALDLKEGEFPYPRRHHAEWFWESGFDQDPVKDLELIRDWNLRANFGAWHAMKNKGAYARNDAKAHANSQLEWMAYIGGTRETLQLLGDVILSQDDVAKKRSFPDASVLTTWSIDLHYPQQRYLGKYAHNPFISKAVHNTAVDRKNGYPVPYRCFYSRNIDNLFMAGRNVSVTHEALGTVRVMKTCGMMGVVVGKAAAVAKAHNTTPRGVYESHLDELIALMKLPGAARRETLTSDFAEDVVPVSGLAIASLKGTVVDTPQAKFTGEWGTKGSLSPYVGNGYRYSTNGTARFEYSATESGTYDFRINWQAHENRSTKTKVRIEVDGKIINESFVNQREAGLLKHGFHSLGRYPLAPKQKAAVIILSEGSDGHVSADALQVLKVK